jgi:hypothetical protein
MQVDPTAEHQKDEMKRQKQWRHRAHYIDLSKTPFTSSRERAINFS